MNSAMSTGWLDMVKEALIREGFYDPGILQVVKPGQVFGLVGKLDDVWEMHVRGFEDQTLEAEIEVSRDYLEHFNDEFRTDATDELTRILDAYGIQYSLSGNLPRTTLRLSPPERLTPWKPLAGLAAFFSFLYFLSRRKG